MHHACMYTNAEWRCRIVIHLHMSYMHVSCMHVRKCWIMLEHCHTSMHYYYWHYEFTVIVTVTLMLWRHNMTVTSYQSFDNCVPDHWIRMWYDGSLRCQHTQVCLLRLAKQKGTRLFIQLVQEAARNCWKNIFYLQGAILFEMQSSYLYSYDDWWS